LKQSLNKVNLSNGVDLETKSEKRSKRQQIHLLHSNGAGTGQKSQETVIANFKGKSTKNKKIIKKLQNIIEHTHFF